MCNTQRRTNATWDSRWAVMKETCLYFYESKESRVIENSFVISDVRLLVLEQVSSGWPAILASATVCSASFPLRILSASSSLVYLAYSCLMLLVSFSLSTALLLMQYFLFYHISSQLWAVSDSFLRLLYH